MKFEKAVTELRCKNCNKLLATGEGNVKIKCPRCGETNEFKPERPERQLTVKNG